MELPFFPDQPDEPDEPGQSDQPADPSSEEEQPATKRHKHLSDSTLYNWFATRRVAASRVSSPYAMRASKHARQHRLCLADEEYLSASDACAGEPPALDGGADKAVGERPGTAAGSCEAVAAGAPVPHRLSEDAHWEMAPWREGHRFYRTTFISSESTSPELLGDCVRCVASGKSILDYAPCPVTQASDCAAFVRAVEEWRSAALATGDDNRASLARYRVDALRERVCTPCTDLQKQKALARTTAKYKIDLLLKERCAKNNGCQNQACLERGSSAWCVLREFPSCATSRGAPSGTERVHFSKWICSYCHKLESYPDLLENLTDIQSEKVRYVYSLMHQLKACGPCKRPVVSGHEGAFGFYHTSKHDRKFSINHMIMQNTDATRLEIVADALDAELAKCRLECANCRARRKATGP
jgi:hypothetical protein